MYIHTSIPKCAREASDRDRLEGSNSVRFAPGAFQASRMPADPGLSSRTDKLNGGFPKKNQNTRKTNENGFGWWGALKNK